MDNYVIRAVALTGYDELVGELGGDVESLYLAAGVDREDFEDSERFIPYEIYLRLINSAAEKLDCDDFGFQLSKKKNGSHLGILSLIIQTSPSILDALQSFSRFLHFQSKSATLNLHTEGEFTFWKHTIHYQGDESLRHAYLNAMGVGISIFRLIGNGSLKPVSGYSIFNKDKGETHVPGDFNCPVTYNAEFSGWKFKTKDLQQARLDADPGLNQLLKNQIQTLLDADDENFELNIKEVIRRALAIGDPSIDRVANYLGKNRRSLQRQLESQQLLYKELLDDVRLEMAKHHLRYSNLPLTHIADILCYSDLSAFSRFFSKRLATTPSKWRKLHAQT